MIVISRAQKPSQERLDGEIFEVLTAHLQSPDRPRDAVCLQAKILRDIRGHGGKHRIVIANSAHFRIGKYWKGQSGAPQRHHPVCMWHIQRLQDQTLQHAEDDDVRGDAQRGSSRHFSLTCSPPPNSRLAIHTASSCEWPPRSYSAVNSCR
jgi:hypothetical protein